MTAPLSTGKYAYPAYRFTEMKGRIIALCLMSLFSYPLVSAGLDLMLYADLEKRRGPVPPENYADLDARTTLINGIGMILIIAACVMLFVLFLQGLFTAKESMRRLWNRKYTDMDMSLPVSFNTRFSGDVLSGFGIYVIPQFIAVGIAMLLLIPADSMLSEIRGYLTANSSDAGSVFEFYRGIIGYLLCANVMQYFFSLMIISFCGRKLTANIVPFIFGLGIPCTLFFLSVIAGAGCYGANAGELMYGPLWDCTPVGMILSSFTSYTPENVGLFHDLSWLRAILYSLAFGTAAYFLIKHRREERTGYAFVYKLGRYATELVIMLTSASVIYLAVLHDPDFDTGLYGVAELVYDLLKVPSAVLLSTWLVINLIVFVIIELVSREKLTKPKKLGLAVLRFAASAGVSFLICFGVFSSDGFGAGAYVPGVSEIGSVGMYWYSSDMYAIDHYAEVKDESAVKLITDYHRRIIAERPDEYFNSLSLSYYMKNGEYVHRTYYLPTEYTLDCTKLWFESGAFAEGCKSRMPGYDAIPRLSVNVGTVGNINGEAVWTKAGIGANEFLTALTHDVEKTAYEDIFRHDGAGYIWVALLPENSITSQYKFQVWDTFEETRGLLRECNCDVFGQLLDDHAVKFYMYKATSLGDYTTKKKLMETVDIYGDTRVYDEPREYRELDYVTARELITKSAVMTMYSESRDIYIIVPSYEFLDENGEKYFRTGYSGDYEYYVTEANLDEAAGIYANAPAATDDELRKYLGVINNYTWGE